MILLVSSASAGRFMAGIMPGPREDFDAIVLGWSTIARMGNEPKKSMLSKRCQPHDIKHLFVMDRSNFVSSGCQNPIPMALVFHSFDYLIGQAKKGDL